MNRPIESITDDDVRAVLNAITDAGQSATMAYEMACSVFKYADDKGYVSSNPTLYVDAPKRRGRTANFLGTADAVNLLNKCRRLSGPVGPAVADLAEFILGTGLRISEALGLIVADVHVDDVDAAWIDVERRLSRWTRENPRMRRVALKTDAAERRVVLDSDTASLVA